MNVSKIAEKGSEIAVICCDRCKCAKQSYIVENVDMCYYVRKQKLS